MLDRLRSRPANGDLGALAVFLFGLSLVVHPGLLAARFAERDAALPVARALGVAFTAIGAGTALLRYRREGRLRGWVEHAVALVAYLALSAVFLDWHIDDAAITYAYSENLARGLGLVITEHHAPEEAYSSTLWMLLLAAARVLGADVALAAKALGTAVGAIVVVLALVTLRRITGRPLTGPAYTLTLGTLLATPFVVWSVSGLEHGLHAASMLVCVLATTRPSGGTWLAALACAALVLLRPEAPLTVVALFAVLSLDAFRAHRRWRSLPWAIAIVPFATFVALLAFRSAYFGDLLPNPYYAKATHASFARLLSPFGSGWAYVFDWIFRGGGAVLVVCLLALGPRGAPLPVRAALAMLLGQLAFVVYAGGDWMGMWRFLAAPIPLFAVLVGYGVSRVERLGPGVPTIRFAWFAATLLTLANVPLLVSFRAAPTTPYALVAGIGREFVSLGRRLGIERPLLAHHDAGGTTYRARIDLLDLAGLGDRIIAKHRDDPAFPTRYILETRRPDFVFGASSNFAAGTSRFHETERFLRDYVPVVFEGKTFMRADLCHVRRDRLREARGVVVERDTAGEPIRVVVR